MHESFIVFVRLIFHGMLQEQLIQTTEKYLPIPRHYTTVVNSNNAWSFSNSDQFKV